MPCLKCGGQTDEDALICDRCADASFQEPKFFLNPVLLGQSLYFRLRSAGSAAYLLGPTSGSDVVAVPSMDLETFVRDVNPQTIPHEDLKGFYQRCDTILAHQGVPLRLDSPEMLLTDDAASVITSVLLKVNAAEKMYPLEGMSDLYIRVGMVYWRAANGILLKTASKAWRDKKRSYLVARSKEYFSKVSQGDDLRSIAARNLGMLCLDAEEWTEAEDNLAEAQRSFPSDLAIGEGIARAHLMMGNQLEALTKVDEAINITETPGLWVLKGRILRSMDRSEEAVECFNRALSLDPRFIPAHDLLISTLRDTGRLEEATLAETQKGLSKRPGLEKKIGDLISEFKKASEGEEIVEAGLETPASKPAPKQAAPPVPPPSSLDPARAAFKAGDFDLAIQRATTVLKGSPGSGDAELLLIEVYLKKGDLRAADPLVHSFYEKNRNDPKAWYWRGAAAEKEGKWGASIQYFSKAVSLDPKYADAWTSMGEVLLGNGKLQGADESFSRSIAIDDDDARAWLGKARTMKQMGRWGAAIQCLDRYQALSPTDKAAWLLKADTLFEKEKWERAVEAYDKYLELVQDDSHALGRKGIALNAIGRVDEARTLLEESVRLDPENKEASKWLKSLGAGGEA